MIVFSLTRIMPGSPIEQALQKQSAGEEEGGKGSSDGPQGGINEDDLEKLEEEFDYDKIIPIAYLNWLGAKPREREIIKKEISEELLSVETASHGVLTFKRRGPVLTSSENSKGSQLGGEWDVKLFAPGMKLPGEDEILKGYGLTIKAPGQTEMTTHRFSGAKSVKDYQDTSVEARLVVFGSGQTIVVEVDANDPTKIISTKYLKSDGRPEDDGWNFIVQTPDDRKDAAARRYDTTADEVATVYDYRVKVFKTRFNGVLQGSFGKSVKYEDYVIDMILDRVPIALYFGILSSFIIYGVCIPLGIIKGIRHRSLMDNASSILIFIGYSIPGFAFGALLLVYLGARNGWFPLFGLMSEDAESFSSWGKLVDLAHHTVLPLAAYVISGFAGVTMMMKNNLMDNLSADYVRTAVAKGVSFKSAVFKHAFRNSFIPIATGLGGLITIFVAGSLLIERVFDIQGFGMLSFTAVEQRDQTVIMGTLTISAFLMIIGNILSDVIVAMVDPRIKFSK